MPLRHGIPFSATIKIATLNIKLLWEGLSKTMNPSKVKGFVEELVSQTVKKLKETGMVNAAA